MEHEPTKEEMEFVSNTSDFIAGVLKQTIKALSCAYADVGEKLGFNPTLALSACLNALAKATADISEFMIASKATNGDSEKVPMERREALREKFFDEIMKTIRTISERNGIPWFSDDKQEHP